MAGSRPLDLAAQQLLSSMWASAPDTELKRRGHSLVREIVILWVVCVPESRVLFDHRLPGCTPELLNLVPGTHAFFFKAPQSGLGTTA